MYDDGITSCIQFAFRKCTGCALNYFFCSIVKFTFSWLQHCSGARRVGSDGSMSASGSAGPGLDPRRGSKF